MLQFSWYAHQTFLLCYLHVKNSDYSLLEQWMTFTISISVVSSCLSNWWSLEHQCYLRFYCYHDPSTTNETLKNRTEQFHFIAIVKKNCHLIWIFFLGFSTSSRHDYLLKKLKSENMKRESVTLVDIVWCQLCHYWIC